MILHTYVAIPVSGLCPGQVICTHSPSGAAAGWEDMSIPRVLLTVDEVRRTIDGYEVLGRRLGAPPDSRRVRLAFTAGHDEVLVEPSADAADQLLAAMRGVLQTTLGRSGVLVGYSHTDEAHRILTTAEQTAKVQDTAEATAAEVLGNGQEALADA